MRIIDSAKLDKKYKNWNDVRNFYWSNLKPSDEDISECHCRLHQENGVVGKVLFDLRVQKVIFHLHSTQCGGQKNGVCIG